MALSRAIQRSSLATLAGLAPHYLAFYIFGSPLWTATLSEWIMARMPSHYALGILHALGPWAKPFAVTGALALLGFTVFLALPFRWAGPLVAATGMGLLFGYSSWLGQLSFWLPVAWFSGREVAYNSSRRELLASAAMGAGVVGVAVECFARDRMLARRAEEPAPLFPFSPPGETFAPGLVRKAVTPVREFYGMSKNAVDPVIDPRAWHLKITAGGRTLGQFGYGELLALPRVERFVTLRCISNTLKSDLMGTAQWSGIRLSQLVDRNALPPGMLEAAILGADGHADSIALDYAFSDEVLLALGMNGQTLDRIHGFPIRLLTPRYYGFKNVKWISEIAFTTQPFFGTWPKMGYTKEPVVHTASHIDRIVPGVRGLNVGGVSFAGTRGIQAVRVRADQGPWVEAAIEPSLSPYTWTRWFAALPVTTAKQVEASARDGLGHWQESVERPLFPDGMAGPSIRSLSS